jgi:hypothetical protein
MKKKDGRTINCITVIDNLDSSLTLSSFFFDLDEDESKICKHLCQTGVIGKKAILDILVRFQNMGGYTSIDLIDEAMSESPWRIGNVYIPIDRFHLSLHTLLRCGLCYYERAGFYAFYHADWYGERRIAQICTSSAFQIKSYSGSYDFVDLIKKYSICELYLLIKLGKVVDPPLLLEIGSYLEEVFLSIHPRVFHYIFDDYEHQKHLEILVMTNKEYVKKYKECKKKILQLSPNK